MKLQNRISFFTAHHCHCPMDFGFIKHPTDRFVLEEAYRVVTFLELWEFFRTYVPDPNTGFMFDCHENVRRVSTLLKTGHTGATFAFTMRQIQMVAKLGFESYKAEYIAEHDL